MQTRLRRLSVAASREAVWMAAAAFFVVLWGTLAAVPVGFSIFMTGGDTDAQRTSTAFWLWTLLVMVVLGLGALATAVLSLKFARRWSTWFSGLAIVADGLILVLLVAILTN